MTNLLDDDFGLDMDSYPKPKRAKPTLAKDLGNLHALLTRGLPDFHKDGALDVRQLGKAIGVSYQAIYIWFENEQMSRKRVDMIVHLSEKTVNKPTREENGGKVWTPLAREQFWEFLSR